MEAVCNACSPPDQSKTTAVNDWIMPHVNLIQFGGLRFPCVLSVPRTNVAESADVIKKVAIKTMAMSDMNAPRGNCSRSVNKATSFPCVSMTFCKGT